MIDHIEGFDLLSRRAGCPSREPMDHRIHRLRGLMVLVSAHPEIKQRGHDRT